MCLARLGTFFKKNILWVRTGDFSLSLSPLSEVFGRKPKHSWLRVYISYFSDKRAQRDSAHSVSARSKTFRSRWTRYPEVFGGQKPGFLYWESTYISYLIESELWESWQRDFLCSRNVFSQNLRNLWGRTARLFALAKPAIRSVRRKNGAFYIESYISYFTNNCAQRDSAQSVRAHSDTFAPTEPILHIFLTLPVSTLRKLTERLFVLNKCVQLESAQSVSAHRDNFRSRWTHYQKCLEEKPSFLYWDYIFLTLPIRTLRKPTVRLCVFNNCAQRD